MTSMLRTLGIVLWRRGPELLAAYLAGAAAHFLLVRLAALVTAGSEFWAIFVQPLPILARLISYVVMILVVRDSLPSLTRVSALSSSPRTPAAQRSALVSALLASILPFFAFYYAAGLLKEDMRIIVGIATEIQTTWTLAAYDTITADTPSASDTAALTINAWVLAVVVVAFGLRALLKRNTKKLPRWTALLSVYLEVVWVFLTVLVIKTLVDGATQWIQGRTAFAWLFGIGDWLAQHIPAVAAAWEAILTTIGVIAGLVSTPLAWLTIVGVVYGQAIVANTPTVSVLAAAKKRYGRVNSTVREGVSFAIDQAAGTTQGRLATIIKALSMALHAGPVFIASYVLLFQLWQVGAGWLDVGLLRLFGPLAVDQIALWTPIMGALASAISEPIRAALVSAAYDTVLTSTVKQGVKQAESHTDDRAVPADPSEAAQSTSAISTLSSISPPSTNLSDSAS